MLTTFDILFTKRYLVSVPNMYTRSVESIDVYGRISSGHRDVDIAVANSTTIIGLTAFKIGEYLLKTIPVGLRSSEDAKEIYFAIDDHMCAMREYKNKRKSINSIQLPKDELKILDLLQKKIYEEYGPSIGLTEIDSYVDPKSSRSLVAYIDGIFGTGQTETTLDKDNSDLTD